MPAEEQFQFELEQDEHGGDSLPTYDDLAVQNGPNSRFGRWRGWIEKRAAERYTDITQEERERRRERGWDLQQPQAPDVPILLNQPPTPTAFDLRIQTNLPTRAPPEYPEERPLASPASPPPLVGQSLFPAHLAVNQFGSRFLPHTTSPIRCLLPLISDRLLLIGHDEGLSVLDMFPKEWTETGGISVKGPDQAQARLIWEGEGVHQMTLLEVENSSESTPQGVILALVGPQPDYVSSKDPESMRTLRMYNLASLTSLAKWTIAQKTSRPLDLCRPAQWTQQTPTKKHRPHGSITRSFKSLMESPNSPHQSEPHSSSYQALLSSGIPLTSGGRLTPNRGDSNSSDSAWDIVDDLPLRWATDFVPLATPGSRLINTSVISYALSRDENRPSKGGAYLAVATKSNILLYESPRGQRAFHFIKEFYTPLQPKSMTFVEQSVPDVFRRTSESHSRSPHNRFSSVDSARDRRISAIIPASATLGYGSQRSLFVIFEKKAGIIRIADSAVSEVELYEEQDTLSTPTHSRRSRSSHDGGSPWKESKPIWVPPTRAELPTGGVSLFHSPSRAVYFLTRGKQTHVVVSPLPANIHLTTPLLKLNWENQPTCVTPRVCFTPDSDEPPMLQLVALGEYGVEVQEVSLSFLNSNMDKGKGRAEEPVRAHTDLGGDVGFLCEGGHWHRIYRGPGSDSARPQLTRSYSVASDVSSTSFDSLGTEEILAKVRVEQGIYGWWQKGLEDWRVFWVGGTGTGEGGYNAEGDVRS